MSRIMDEFRKEIREEERIKLAAIVLKSGKIPEEKLKQLFKFTEKQMAAIKAKAAKLA